MLARAVVGDNFSARRPPSSGIAPTLLAPELSNESSEDVGDPLRLRQKRRVPRVELDGMGGTPRDLTLEGGRQRSVPAADDVGRWALAPCDVVRKLLLVRLLRGDALRDVAQCVPPEQPYEQQFPHHVAWRERPSTYVVCGRDGALAPAFQREVSRRATHAVELDSGHSPFLAQPERVADILGALVRELGRE